MRSELIGVPPCQSNGEHPFWCHALGACMPRPALLDELGEIAWQSGRAQWTRPVETVTVAHRGLL